MEENMRVLTYLDLGGSIGPLRWGEQFLTYWVAYSHMIPISLYVIIEMLKLLLREIINRDVKMFFVEDMQFAQCRNSDLIEELGQVEFVFSDKTGTLTQNKMEFKKCQASNAVWGNTTPEEVEAGIIEQPGMRETSAEVIRESLSRYHKLFLHVTDDFARKNINEKNPPPPGVPDDVTEIYLLFRLLAVCHTVVVDVDLKTGEIQYQASSPDELALINGAKQMGLVLLEKSTTSMIIQNEYTGQKDTYEILAEFPFDSTRKRMTLIVRFNGEIIMLTKGADSIMLPRINFRGAEAKRMQIMRDLLFFAKEGLRTLVVAQKPLSVKDYERFSSDYQKLKTSTSADKDKKLDRLYDSYE